MVGGTATGDTNEGEIARESSRTGNLKGGSARAAKLTSIAALKLPRRQQKRAGLNEAILSGRQENVGLQRRVYKLVQEAIFLTRFSQHWPTIWITKCR